MDCRCDGTDFEVINCPSFNSGYCFRVKSNSIMKCREIKDCIIKNHMVCLSALVGITKPGTAEMVGARACFNSFIVNKIL